MKFSGLQALLSNKLFKCINKPLCQNAANVGVTSYALVICVHQFTECLYKSQFITLADQICDTVNGWRDLAHKCFESTSRRKFGCSIQQRNYLQTNSVRTAYNIYKDFSMYLIIKQ